MILQAGLLLVRAANLARREGLTGLEFASGIPGTVGGAMVMNAGAYGGEMKDVIRRVTVLTREGEIRSYTGEEMAFGYRTSRIAAEGSVVLEAELELEKDEPEKIQSRMDELKEKRIAKQPLEYASAGSTFKRPEGYFAGKLIEDAGLRGFRIGDAQVSEKHCGFVINRGEATASQIAELIREVQKRVYEHSGVHLETEVKFVGWKGEQP
jgi:UDP-N-acetylmuramate dehydrogenase